MGRSLLAHATQVALFSYLAFYLLESLFPRFVSLYFDFGTLLYGVLLLLVLDIVLPRKGSLGLGYRAHAPPSTRFVVVVAIGVTLLLLVRLSGLGWVGLVIAVIGGLVVASVSRAAAGPGDLSGSDNDRTLRP